MRLGQRYVCQNQACRCEMEVVKASTEAAPNPRCCCGAEMRKEYKKARSLMSNPLKSAYSLSDDTYFFKSLTNKQRRRASRFPAVWFGFKSSARS